MSRVQMLVHQPTPSSQMLPETRLNLLNWHQAATRKKKKKKKQQSIFIVQCCFSAYGVTVGNPSFSEKRYIEERAACGMYPRLF